MPLIVQKFGGTSVADSQKILAAARKAIRAHQNGKQVVMVVSAMGHSTDALVDLAQEISDNPPAREMDMLLSTGEQVSVALMAMAIHSLGFEAVSMTGAQIGIRTDSTHTKARIHSISTDRMRQALDAGKIVIAAGFQGIDQDYNITTLGRGGSDTTAVALAAVLGAEACEIYTDVDGVYTTDPRVLPEARMVRQVSYDEMLELASLGAGVMHSRSIEFAKKFNVPIHVRNSFADITGSVIAAKPEAPGQAVSGATLVKNEARVTLLGVPDRPGTSHALFSKIAAKNISVDMIVQNVGADTKADISFTVIKDDLKSTLRAMQEAADELEAEGFTHDDNVSKVSVVGLGMATQTGVAQKMFRALADAGINILMITTSEIKISVLVSKDQGLAALRTLHREFELDKAPSGRNGGEPLPHAGVSDAAAVVARLQGMEDLAIDDVRLDESQARVTVAEVPDSPGLAAAVFEGVAAGGIFVDMIVQSFGVDGLANLSFTVPRSEVEKAVEVARQLAQRLRCGPVTHSPRVAKLSVSGIGMRSHTGVAIRMFRSLAEAGINVEMINTSEVRVNVVVAGEAGQRGLACLQQAFSDALR
ncbi:MAG TPA: aspartate kinase [Pirellulales bacterium]|jgi:aspartate kinase|nr:aspartate kinase [Pirellulales bacterium]